MNYNLAYKGKSLPELTDGEINELAGVWHDTRGIGCPICMSNRPGEAIVAEIARRMAEVTIAEEKAAVAAGMTMQEWYDRER
jgi:hypothetical protein